MDFAQLQLFVSIVQLKTISRAAESMNITQSAASQSLARMESELGCRLFVRRKRGLELCPEGSIFYGHALKLLHEMEIAQQQLNANHQQISGMLYLRVYAASALMPQLIYNFHQAYPNVQISMKQQMSADDFDLCITTDDMGPVPHSARRLYDEEIMLAVPADHPRFSLQSTVELADIADENFIMTRSGSALRILANRLFRQAGMEPRIIFEGDNPSIVRDLITMGLGVALFPRISWQRIIDDSIHLVHLSAPPCRRSLYIYAPANRIITSTIRTFLDYATQYFSEIEMQTMKNR